MENLAEIPIEREFAFSDREFNYIRDLVRRLTGIALSDNKRELVYSRLSRRLRQLGLKSFSQYCERIGNGNGNDPELIELVNAITTNLTSFFRESHHFQFLQEQLLPQLLDTKPRGTPLRIWSAGCSTGEEPYSIAITVKETVPPQRLGDIKILASDLDSNVVQTAQQGFYELARAEHLPRERLRRWFLRGKGSRAGWVSVVPELREMICFRQLNLMADWPINGPIDIIFCRNVIIYFDRDTQRVLLERFAGLLNPQGHLFVGHSESLFKVTEQFTSLGKTIYRRCQ